jgi:AcrR family transcriptional regulator
MTSVAGPGGGVPEEVSAGVVGRLRARRAEIDEAIFARVSDRWFDRTGSGDPEYVEGLRAAGVAALDYVLVGIERSGVSLEPVPAATLDQARRAARTGVGVDTVLRRYLAGYAVVEGVVMQEAEHDELLAQPSALRDVLQRMSVLVDRLIAAVSSAYSKELERAGNTVLPTGDHAAPRARTSQRERTSRRDRILEVMVEVVAERGFAGASVRLVTVRAGVSSRTFYECFEGLEDCFTAVIDEATEQAGVLIMQAFARERSWRDGVRAALAALLVFFDSEPLLARMWLVEVLAAGSWALEHRERKIAVLSSMIVEHWSVPGEERPQAPVIAGVMASVLGLIHTHLVTKEPRPLIGLLGPLMGLVTSPYMDPEAVALEIQQATELSRKIQQERHELSSRPSACAGAPRRVEIPALLRNPKAGRARLCMRYLAEQGGRGSSPSNHQVAAAIGVTHQGQISTLLARLHGLGLVVKYAGAPGHPNAWSLTAEGNQIAQALEDY